MGLDWARAPWFTTAPAGKRGSPGASLVPKGWECLVPASRCSLRSLTLCSAQQPVCFSGFGASVCAGKGQRFFSVACLSLSHHFVLPPSEVEPLLTPSSPDFHSPPQILEIAITPHVRGLSSQTPGEHLVETVCTQRGN